MPERRLRQANTALSPGSDSGLVPENGSGLIPIVAIGASAGGLDACRKLVDALPGDSGMAFILVQHLDPTHASMMVDLLTDHTPMPVLQAAEGMAIEPDHFYVIPPGTYLSVVGHDLHLSPPQARHGARLPFDFLLHSLAETYGPLAMCVVLSGTGADGSLGACAIKARGGLVIAQDPDEAGYDGMPRSAIATGAVDHVLPVAAIAAALAEHLHGVDPSGPDNREPATAGPAASPDPKDQSADLDRIVDLLRTRTAHDFTLYKYGTLRRRIERRMSIAGIEAGQMGRYVARLNDDAAELDLLANDLLINVTSFFRDPEVFDTLARTIIPELVRGPDPLRGQAPERTLRVWIAGCSTGEESYSLAMLFREAIAEAKSNVKLQLFASDVDPDAVASAREGLYPVAIAADVSPARLARFFVREDRFYRVLPELRATVVFTVQDVLTDPPFSRIDMVSCRNLLIYLRPEAQAKVVSLFHFALREAGVLLLGSSETVLNPAGRFELISKTERIYRHIGRSRPGEVALMLSAGDGMRGVARPGQPPSRQAALADLCRRLVMETYAPAAILINRRHECLYFLGPTDRYLKVAQGHPTNDLLAMARDGMRIKLRAAIQRATDDNARALVPGGRVSYDGASHAFSIAVHPVQNDGEDLLLICFIDEPRDARPIQTPSPRPIPRLAELEQELDATKEELQTAIRNLEISSEEQKAINEEALSVGEEYQSTNEELMTSKEELQSLNEELTALNSQLQETLERQRTTANDLQNILYSTDVATLFLDAQLDIRFFTPATRSIFSVIPGDIGRPLADLRSLAADPALLSDATAILKTLAPIEREVEGADGAWYARRVLPYRTLENGVEGVVITFTDITEAKRVERALEVARQEAEVANIAKSRFLAAASHDLRQPMQTLALLQGLLTNKVEEPAARKLVALMEPTMSAMSGMLNTLLDINQIDAGTVHAQPVDFPIGDMLDRLRDEFAYHAQAQGLVLHVVPCSLTVRTDPRLLEQMVRNLLSNAFKYTTRGRVLLGCRRSEGKLAVEVWDTGIGIAAGELDAIFGEYHQIDNAARERSRGLGLGLSIVKRLAVLLGHRVRVRSNAGKGSVFSIEIDMPLTEPTPLHGAGPADGTGEAPVGAVSGHRTGSILVIEDDPDLRELLELLLAGDGHDVTTAADGLSTAAAVAVGSLRPDLVIADFNLPSGSDGLHVAVGLREKLRKHIPVIILTGDISTETLREIAGEDCVQLNKPVTAAELSAVVQRLLPPAAASVPAPAPAGIAAVPGAPPVVFVVDDEREVRQGLRRVLEEEGFHVEDFASCEAFLAAYRPGGEACLLLDAYLPGMRGLELLRRLRSAGHALPCIMITGASDVAIAVQAMKAGASDFIEKPVGRGDLLAGVTRALEQSQDAGKLVAWREAAASRVADLTARQVQVMERVLAGHPSKNIAADLGISQRTVENHRASIMRKTGAKSLPALARLALAAASRGADDTAAPGPAGFTDPSPGASEAASPAAHPPPGRR